jgi:GH15 family glucan-1,4-alpha-glucosidase
MSYPAIEDHGLIGDLQTAALVATDGTIDWFCCPRFDSPSVFASLLDDEKGGRFSISSATPGTVTKQMYLPDTAVLVTRYLSDRGVAEVLDFMPIHDPGTATDERHIVRAIVGVRGEIELEARIEPRFDYGRAPHSVEVQGSNAWFNQDGLTLRLASVVPLERHGEDLSARLTVRAGEASGFVLSSGDVREPLVLGGGRVRSMLAETVAFWRDWLAQSTYRGRWREAVNRSAITLKLMTYAPTGALVAAPTAGLPEQVGGERNWDYRYTWVRDGSFSVYALLGLGFTEEAAAFGRWLRDRIVEAPKDGGGFDIMFRIDGSSDLKEEELDHLEGYRGSRPVRIGNGAAGQLQLDIFGEALDAIYHADQNGLGIADVGWSALADTIDWLAAHWDQPDEGIWETRGGRQPFVYGRLMSWVAFDRAIRLAERHGRPAQIDGWREARDRAYRDVMDKGWNADVGAFVQFHGSDVLDASILMMPLVGFVTPSDPKWQSTLDAIDRTLVSDSLVYRYDPKASPDGLRGAEGTFSICTFWFVDALARSGRLDASRLVFEKMLTYANHVGLYAEEIGLTGEQLGNFPQAFTHLSLINAAINLDYQLDHGAGRVGVIR